jgi:predicted lipoprotein with Yx(FWY)xxD motif
MYQGEPLYYYYEDTAPGDAKGQGLEDIWFAASPATVMLGGNQGFGNFLVGPGGLTLYVFLEDEEAESYCYEECIHAWPPLLVNSDQTPLVGQGIPGFVGTTQREDGAVQVTYNGAPLYFFYEDEAPGDTNGNGSKEVWYVAVPEAAAEPIQVGVELVAEGLSAPIALIPTNDGTGRMLLADQAGLIHVLMPDGSMLGQPFLDLTSQIVPLDPNYDERGILGLAVHPAFANNGRFYVYYSAPLRPEAPPNWNTTSTIAEFLVSPNDPNVADPTSQRILLQIDKPQMNHNAGQIAFGPDGYLYIPIGDGGGANDTDEGHTPNLGNGQDTSNLLGSILRIDINNGSPYAIPPDNPFVGDDSIPDEIFAYGLRNPFRIAFDIRGDGSLYASDAGQNLFEEVDLITAGGNYGWNIKEGTHCFDPNNPTQPPATCDTTGARGEPLIDPIIQHDHRTGVVVVGGYVYRGSAIPELSGQYVFGDYSRLSNVPSGVLMTALPSTDGTLWNWTPLEVVNGEDGGLGAYLLSFGQDPDGEIYVLTTEMSGPTGNTGKVWRLIPAREVPAPVATVEVTAVPSVPPTATPISVTATFTTTPAPTAEVTTAPTAEATPEITEVPTTEVTPPTEPTAEVTAGS